jgi:hypothetical protein
VETVLGTVSECPVGFYVRDLWTNMNVMPFYAHKGFFCAVALLFVTLSSSYCGGVGACWLSAASQQSYRNN